MRTISIERPAEWDVCEVHCFADAHIGDKQTNYDLLKQRIKHCEDTENCIVLLNGDLCNTATKTSVSDIYAESIRPMEQMQRVVDLFGKLAEQDKIAAVTDGNHERRIYKQDGIDLTEVIATQLGIRDRYSSGMALVFLRFGERTIRGQHRRKMLYTLALSHGAGGGAKIGGKASRLVGLSEIVDADVYWRSHVHEPLIVKRNFFRTSAANSSVQSVTRLFVNTAAYTEWGGGGYCEQGEFVPNSTDTPTVFLDGHERKMWAKL